MKKILILLAAFGSLNAHAAWVSYQRSADADELYDSQLVSRDGTNVKLWTMTNFAKPMTTLEGKDYQSEKMLTTIDCAKKKTGAEQVVRLSGRDGQGDVISTMDSPLRLVAVKAGSADESLLAKVCR
jgi:hypothetical protein